MGQSPGGSTLERGGFFIRFVSPLAVAAIIIAVLFFGWTSASRQEGNVSPGSGWGRSRWDRLRVRQSAIIVLWALLEGLGGLLLARVSGRIGADARPPREPARPRGILPFSRERPLISVNGCTLTT